MGIILGSYMGYIGIMEKKMETTIVYGDNIGRMDLKMETTIVYRGYICIRVQGLGFMGLVWLRSFVTLNIVLALSR